MRVFVSGSLAYDRIMDYPGRFSDHILPDKIHQLSVSFNVATYRQSYGGTAGNIGYSLAQLGIEPRIVARYGHDFAPYQAWLRRCGVSLQYSKPDRSATAAAHMMTDRSDNQITGFFPGALVRPYGGFPRRVFAGVTLAIIAPGNLTDMERLPSALARNDVPYFYDPGQSTTALSRRALDRGLAAALGLFCNDYELDLILKKTRTSLDALRRQLGMVVVTKGERGSDIYAGGARYHIPIVRARRVVDPTGAGDAYRAGFIAGLLRGYTIPTIGRIAATVAVAAVEHYGTQEHRLNWPQVRLRYRRSFGRLPT